MSTTTAHDHPFHLLLEAFEQPTNEQNAKKHIFHPTHTVVSMAAASSKIRKQSAKSNTKEFQINLNVKGICQNRECNNESGYDKKPNSIYCSSRCQSRGLYILT